ncbi:hypothetical protein [Stieleria varia]|uniref:Uncharacterized protein n=1 Tax=Stieleria varia TaxID=2528005 RepID=A0A5C6ASC0_9BACT|nr:hypothetical protein [Stieleria varia]TWU01074.1 hypothetical protein Pla52n_44450 [Stieleria varia]
MKIRQIRFNVCRNASRAFAMAAVALLATACSDQAHAQSGLLNYLSTQPQGSALSAPQGSPMGNVNGFANSNVQVIGASDVRTAADLNKGSGGTVGSSVSQAFGPTRLGPGAISQAVGTLSDDSFGIQQVSCQSCGTGNCGGACGGHGGYSGYGSHGSYGDACGVPCPAYYYVSAEALYMKRRGDGGFTLAQNFGMGKFDYEWAPRITIGSVPDCVHGYELVWTGPLEWEREAVVRDTVNSPFNAAFVPGLPVAAVDLDNFFTAGIQQQRHTSEYWSVEANKTWIGWDAAKLLIGGRYIDFDEDYFYLSQNNMAETGVLSSGAHNQMYGVQVGLDVMTPIGRHMSTDFRGRAGVYANFVDTDVNLQNDGAFILNNSQSDDEIAGVFEVGSGVRYQLGEMLTVRAGSEFIYLSGVSTAVSQVDSTIRPSMGRQVRIDDDIFIYGLSFGVELRY